MKALSASVDANFIVKGLGLTGITQPTAAELDNFLNEATLDTTIGSTVAAKDLPSLTMNDKVYAARLATAGSVTPLVFEEPKAKATSDEPSPKATKTTK